MDAPTSVVPRGGLLAVHAHPDDETLSTGGLLATWAATGEPVTVVTCTRGEQGEVIATPGTPTEYLAPLEGDGPALAAHRETELAEALDALGVRDHAFLDEVFAESDAADASATTRYTDSGMAWLAPGIAGAVATAPVGSFVATPLDEAAVRLATVIASRQPAVVVTYEPGGGYGHPDHVRARAVTDRALDLLENVDPGVRRPELWEAVVPERELRDARAALGAHPEVARLRSFDPSVVLLDPAGDLPSMATASSCDVRTVEVDPVLGAVLDAMRAHATQVQHATAAQDTPVRSDLLGWYALSNDVLAPILRREFYAVVRASSVRPAAMADQ